MKKIVLALASAALVFGMVSCASNDVEEDEADFSMFVEEEEAPAWTATGEKLTGNSCNTLAADTGVGVTIVVDKDVSKGGKELQGAEVEVVEYLGEKCLKVTPNFNPEIRISFVFDEPITTEAFSGIKFACAGFDGGAGAYNCGLMYAEGDGGAEFPMSFYMTDISSSEWIECNANLVANEQWGNRYSPSKKIQAVQFWSGDKGPLFIKGLSFVK
ncbi:MAG: hypothetical protein K5829_15865 [Treponema sp.]|nr:hypothetical protein [Treponema sp.]